MAVPTGRWEYSDFASYSGTARLARMRSHIDEVRKAIGNPQSYGVSGKSVSYASLQPYLDSLLVEERALAAAYGTDRSMFTRLRAKPRGV